MGHRRDLLAIIEAAYAVDRDQEAWLSGIAESVRANVPFRTVGVVVNGYDISDSERPQLALDGIAYVSADAERLRERWATLKAFYEADIQRTSAGYGRLDEGLGLDIPAEGRQRLAKVLRGLKMGDVYGINGRNPSGKGCLIGVYLPESFAPISASARRMFGRIGRHLAAAHRLRQRLADARAPHAPEHADAVLRPNGKVEHAKGAARSAEARAELRRATVSLATLRGRRRLDDPDRAVAAWKALVDARWSLVDHFERDGSHYLVAHRNDCQPAPMSLLTERERQVAALAAMGFSNKAIAYNLGIATSTVGVLMSRALARLGLRSRRELAAGGGLRRRR